MPQISVCIPFYNAASTLKCAVESILNQTYVDFELILINNNSSDGGREIAEEFARSDKRIRLLDEPRQGVVFAANTGLKVASGKYIARMDADDFTFPDRLEKQVAFLDTHEDIDVVSGQVNYPEKSPKTEGLRLFVEWVNSLRTTKDIYLNRFVEAPVIQPSLMFRRELIDRFGYYREGDFPEDYEMWLRWFEGGVRFGKVDAPVIIWHESETRLTRTDSRYSVDAFYQIKTQYLVRWLKVNVSPGMPIFIWGAGKQSRRRSNLLLEYGIQIAGYFDVVEKEHSEVFHYRQIPPPGEIFILSYVGNRGAREQIKKHLLEKGYREGADFLLVS